MKAPTAVPVESSRLWLCALCHEAVIEVPSAWDAHLVSERHAVALKARSESGPRPIPGSTGDVHDDLLRNVLGYGAKVQEMLPLLLEAAKTFRETGRADVALTVLVVVCDAITVVENLFQLSKRAGQLRGRGFA